MDLCGRKTPVKQHYTVFLKAGMYESKTDKPGQRPSSRSRSRITSLRRPFLGVNADMHSAY